MEIINFFTLSVGHYCLCPYIQFHLKFQFIAPQYVMAKNSPFELKADTKPHGINLTIRLFFSLFLVFCKAEREETKRKAWHRRVYCSFPPPHIMIRITERINQSNSFPVFTWISMYQRACEFTAMVGNGKSFLANGFREFLQNLSWKFVAKVLLFLETCNTEFCNVLCGKPVILVQLLLDLKIIV